MKDYPYPHNKYSGGTQAICHPPPHSILKTKIVQINKPNHQPDTQVKQKQFVSILPPPQSRYNIGQLEQQTIISEQLFQNQQPSRVHNTVPVLKSVGKKQVASDPISQQALHEHNRVPQQREYNFITLPPPSDSTSTNNRAYVQNLVPQPVE